MEDINYRLKLTICASVHLRFLLCGLKRASPGDLFEARSETWKHPLTGYKIKLWPQQRRVSKSVNSAEDASNQLKEKKTRSCGSSL